MAKTLTDGNPLKNGGAIGNRENPTPTPAAWKDLPRRLLTVTIGVPSIILLLRNPITSYLFFQGAHLLCLIEWRALLPSADNSEENDDVSNDGDGPAKNDDVAKNTSKAKGNVVRAFLTKIFTDGTANTSPLSKCMFYVFCLFSFLVTILPTSLLPLEFMSHAIAVRLLPHLPSFQSSNHHHHPTTSTTDVYINMQHYQFGLLYLSIGFHFILRISRIGGPIHVGNLLFIVWMSDTGALVLGRLMKKRRNQSVKEECENNDGNRNGIFMVFLKSISPGKTLPGLLGAIITGPICGLIYPITLPSSIEYPSKEQCDGDREEVMFFSIALPLRNYFYNPLFQKILLGLSLSLGGIVGDLAESTVKRLSKKKDSGGLLPGHGGVVDRFDSLFVAGVFYYYFVFA